MDDTFPLAYLCAIPSVCMYGRWKYALAYPRRRRRKVFG